MRQLTLRVTDGGDGIDSDHGDWADARLREKGV
ncbi:MULTISPECIES: NPCBM/NEW2 domain-containing protein [unclassified Streptomyces]